MSAETIKNIATILRETHPAIVPIFTEGGCYEFFRICHAINQRCEPVHDQVEGHIYARLGQTYFDIRGAWTAEQMLCEPRPIIEKPSLYIEAADLKNAFWRNKRHD